MTSLSDLKETGAVRCDVSLGSFTSYKVGGPAAFFAEVSSHEELLRLGEAWQGSPVEVLVIGRGSNLVISDRGFDGLVLRLRGEFFGIDHLPTKIRAGGAVPLPALARSAVAKGRLGLEFYVGIPGSVGGAIRQNAGGHGGETKDWLRSVEVFDFRSGASSEKTIQDLGASYRSTNIHSQQVVMYAQFGFDEGDSEEGEERIREVIRWRKEHQPGGALNAGSVFKNPKGDSAGRIIDDLGLKGYSVGRVSVSDKHANFFVAEKGVTAQEVYELVETVRDRVLQETGIRLENEIQFVGKFS